MNFYFYVQSHFNLPEMGAYQRYLKIKEVLLKTFQYVVFCPFSLKQGIL